MARGRASAPRDVAALVDRMFADVFTPDERTELLDWIRAWDAEHPDVDAAHRVTGWIDVAYAFQARGRVGRPPASPAPTPMAAEPEPAPVPSRS